MAAALTVVIAPGPAPALDLRGPLDPDALEAALAALPPSTHTLHRHSATHHTLHLESGHCPAGALADLLTAASPRTAAAADAAAGVAAASGMAGEGNAGAAGAADAVGAADATGSTGVAGSAGAAEAYDTARSTDSAGAGVPQARPLGAVPPGRRLPQVPLLWEAAYARLVRPVRPAPTV
ncbi:hypothetical protein [Streptomyces globosus]|uniref:hypothetical protein n=1 Tax=Streptomyces globosus TaxID=68209 RepID=UPI0036351516